MGPRGIVGVVAIGATVGSACAGGGTAFSSSGYTSVATQASTDTTADGDGDDGETGSAATTAGSSADTSSSTAAQGSSETSCEPVTWYHDQDGDGRGDPTQTLEACDPPPGYVAFGDDCDDTDPARSPAAVESCDGIDNDCDSLVDEASADNTSCNGCTLAEYNGHAYALCPNGATWDDARTQCAAFGGDLLKLDDAAEQGAVEGFGAPPPAVPGGFFMGLTDRATEGTFLWYDGSAPSYTSWGAGEPNDAGGNEDCGEIGLGAGVWNDVPCGDLRAFVCEAAPA